MKEILQRHWMNIHFHKRKAWDEENRAQFTYQLNLFSSFGFLSISSFPLSFSHVWRKLPLWNFPQFLVIEFFPTEILFIFDQLLQSYLYKVWNILLEALKCEFSLQASEFHSVEDSEYECGISQNVQIVWAKARERKCKILNQISVRASVSINFMCLRRTIARQKLLAFKKYKFKLRKIIWHTLVIASFSRVRSSSTSGATILVAFFSLSLVLCVLSSMHRVSFQRTNESKHNQLGCCTWTGSRDVIVISKSSQSSGINVFVRDDDNKCILFSNSVCRVFLIKNKIIESIC